MDALRDSKEIQENTNKLKKSIDSLEQKSPQRGDSEASHAGKSENQAQRGKSQSKRTSQTDWKNLDEKPVQVGMFAWSGLAIRIFLFFFLASVVSRLAFALEHFSRTRALGGEFLQTIAYWTIPVDTITACVLSIIPITLCFIQIFRRTDPRRLIRWYMLLAAILLAVIETADMVISGFWGKRLPEEVVVQLRQPWGIISNFSLELTLLSLMRLVPLLIIVVFGVNVLIFHPVERLMPIQKKDLWAIFGLWGGMVCTGIFWFPKVGNSNPAASFSAFQNKNIPFALKLISNPVYTILGHVASALGVQERMQCRIPEKIDSIQFPKVQLNQEKPLRRRVIRSGIVYPNIILVVSESFSSDSVDILNGYPEGTLSPQFNALAQEGVLFSGFYANWMHTHLSISSLLTGNPLPKPYSVQAFPRELNMQKGYLANFFYGGDIHYSNMDNILSSSGVESIFWEGNLFQGTQSLWGVFDDEVFNVAARMISQMAEESPQTPLFNIILTLTNHAPYTVPDGFPSPLFSSGSPLTKGWTQEQFCAHRYADASFGQFVEKLKASNAWENTLLIFVADHGRHGSEFEAEDERRHRIPMLWLGGALDPAVKGTVVKEIGFQSDLAATLLGQLNMDASGFPLSQDMFSPHRLQAGMFVISDNNHFGVVTPEGYDIFSCITGTTMGLGSEAVQKFGWSYVKWVLEERDKGESQE